MFFSKTLLLCAAGAITLAAQQGSVSGPVSGYVFDGRTKVLRTIRGIPGASLVSDSVDFGVAAASAWVSPKLDSALIVDASNAAHIYRLDNGKATERQAPGLVAPERAVFSPGGTALALVTPGSVRIYKGLPDAPTVTGTIELPADRVVAMERGKRLRPGGGAIAVSDDGLYLLYVNGDAIELLGVGGDSRQLTSAAAGATPVFAPGGHDAAVIDGQAIALFQDAAGAATVRRLPGISGAHGAGFSADGKRLFVAAASVASIDVATGDRTDLSCNCRPAGLVRMGSVFRLNDLGSGPLWLVDASAEPRIVFVPAAQ